MFAKIKKIIVNYPERVVLVTAVLALLYFGLSATSETGDPQLDSIKGKTGQLRQMLNINKLPEDQKPPILSGLERAKKNWDDEFLQKPMEINAWLMYRQPVYEVTFNSRPKAQAKRLPAPALKKLETDEKNPDYVKIIWGKNPEPDQSVARTAGYKIYRRAEGEDKFAAVTEPALPVETLTANADGNYEYDDKTVAARVAYTYYLTALTDETNAERTESEPGGQQEKTVPNDVKIEFLSVTPETGVWIKIEKFIKGKWLDKKGSYKEGEPVGKGEFATPYKIKDITDDKMIIRVGANPIEVPAFKIIYEDDRQNVYSKTIKK